MSALGTLISGSSRRHLDQSFDLRSQLRVDGIEVLAPVGESAISGEEEFALLDSDLIADPRTVQDSIFALVRQSSFLTLVNWRHSPEVTGNSTVDHRPIS